MPRRQRRVGFGESLLEGLGSGLATGAKLGLEFGQARDREERTKILQQQQTFKEEQAKKEESRTKAAAETAKEDEGISYVSERAPQIIAATKGQPVVRNRQLQALHDDAVRRFGVPPRQTQRPGIAPEKPNIAANIVSSYLEGTLSPVQQEEMGRALFGLSKAEASRDFGKTMAAIDDIDAMGERMNFNMKPYLSKVLKDMGAKDHPIAAEQNRLDKVEAQKNAGQAFAKSVEETEAMIARGVKVPAKRYTQMYSFARQMGIPADKAASAIEPLKGRAGIKTGKKGKTLSVAQQRLNIEKEKEKAGAEQATRGKLFERARAEDPFRGTPVEELEKRIEPIPELSSSQGPSQEDLEFTAKKYGMTVEEVKQKLGVK